MENKKQYLPKFIWIILLLLLSASAIYKVSGKKELIPLKGAIVKVDFPAWSWGAWKKGEFQEKHELATVKNFGFHSVLIRANNQWNYELWKRFRVNRVSLGEDNYLFGNEYIDGMYGTNYKEKVKVLNEKKASIKATCDAFKQRGKEVVFLVQPGKSYLYPEKIPVKLQKPLPEHTIYKTFIKWAEEEDLALLDFQSYLLDRKKEIPYPLFSKMGAHLTQFAETIVLDSILNFIEARSGKDLYQYNFTEPTIKNEPRGRDNDTEQALNLMFPITKEPLAYSYFKLDSIQKEFLPNILVIGDSFYWGLYPTIDKYGLFGKHQFWYRNHAIFPDPGSGEIRYSNKKTCLESLDNFDMVFIVCTSVGLEKAAWRYFKHVYEGLEGS